MYAKIEISGEIRVVTGMHIGGSSQFAAIGAVDSPVIRDVISDLPTIPGSSLKGKMRTLLAKKYNQNPFSKPEGDSKEILRLFGSSQKGNIKRSRLIFSDMILSNINELQEVGINSATEVKFENTINRLSGEANPRQIERTIRGTAFPLNIIYDVEKEDEIAEDFKIIADGIRLLKYDYIGGSGSRGYGKVNFENIKMKVVVGSIDSSISEKCAEFLKEV